MYYPFVCAVLVLFSFKSERIRNLREKGFYGPVVAGLLFFNPISSGLLLALLIVAVNIISYGEIPQPEGLTVVEVYPNSPASTYWDLKEGTVVFKINGTSINNINQAISIINKTRSSEKIWVDYSGGKSALFLLIANPEFPDRGYLGIKVRDVQGNEAIL